MAANDPKETPRPRLEPLYPVLRSITRSCRQESMDELMAHVSKIVPGEGEQPGFAPGDHVRVGVRFPIGHYRVPHYVRGKTAVIERVIEPRAVNNEEEGFGRNAGSKRHYYRIAIPMTKLWPGYAGSASDRLCIEVFETWLERSTSEDG